MPDTHSNTHNLESYQEFTARTMSEVRADLYERGFTDEDIDTLFFNLCVPDIQTEIFDFNTQVKNKINWMQQHKLASLIYASLIFCIVFGVFFGGGYDIWVISKHDFLLLMALSFSALLGHYGITSNQELWVKMFLCFFSAVIFLIFVPMLAFDKIQGIQQQRLTEFETESCEYDTNVRNQQYICLDLGSMFGSVPIEREALDDIQYIDLVHYPVSGDIVHYNIVYSSAKVKNNDTK